MASDLLTPQQVAARLQVTVHTVYAWLRDGRLRGSKIGRLWRVGSDAVEALLDGDGVTTDEDARLSSDDLAAVRAGLAAIERGDWITLDDLKRKHGV